MKTKNVPPQSLCLFLQAVVIFLAIVIVVAIYYHNNWSLPVLACWQIMFTAFSAFLLDWAIHRASKKLLK